ncbi:MAG: hybrid sensor histidine kinase/response regulator [Aphanocapsa sp. GSE-SYN-MK-11-07L]|jgi:signal transduction histidine kinase|nr:hybrid sensor histidine kinase/response regulator [Aphanocapsa sp. GSE-SYN-MK-11-07L]
MTIGMLRDFIQQVPTCTATTRLKVLLATCQAQAWSTNPQFVVVVDQQEHPIGWLGGFQLAGLLTSGSPDQRLSEHPEFLVSPLQTLHSTLTLPELQSYWGRLRSPLDPVWALTDSTGKYLGVLDLPAVSRWLATASPAALSSASPSSPSSLGLSPTVLSPTVLSLIGQILDSLPLPLMLQTSAGDVLAQNKLWHQQVGQLRNGEQVTQDANQLMAAASSNPIGVCEWGDGPNAWICRCAMPDHQERLWSFARIPLSPIADDQMQPASSDFRLATLAIASRSPNPAQQASPHPAQPASPLSMALHTAWQSLSQPTSLWLVIAEDVTEPQHSNSGPILAEQQQILKTLIAQHTDLQQNHQLQEQFLAAIGHELKTPLTAIVGLATVLQNQSLGELSERQTRYLQMIHQNGRRLISLVNDLLDLGEIDRQQLELAIAPVNIALVCQRAEEQARQELSTTVEFSLKIAPGLEVMQADDLRLRQMLGHLLSNAYKFTPPGGKIGLKVERWQGWIGFTVWDTGLGIPAGRQPLIFQQLQKLEHPLTHRFQGTGTGLILTRRLAQCHGGEVTFISQEHQGSQFTLLLPDLISKDAPNRLVVLAESTNSLQTDLRQKLTALNYQVVVARSGLEALEKIRQLQPWLVFLNPVLPLVSGWDVLSLLKSDPRTAAIPVILTAAETDPIAEHEANGCLTLPVQVGQLKPVLQTWEQQHPASSLDTAAEQRSLRPANKAAPLPFLAELTVLRVGMQTASLRLEYCRVLEADDLEQAALLARIWHPQVVLWDESDRYLPELPRHDSLANLPLVTLEVKTTRTAHQVSGLNVFPCLVADGSTPEEIGQNTRTLWQVLQVAAGYQTG